jgi:hypothetical protein
LCGLEDDPVKNLNVSELTKEVIGGLYLESLANTKTRVTHVSLKPRLLDANAPMPIPSVHDISMDFTSWFGGLLSLANAIDPGCELPPIKELIGYVTQNFERAKAAVAA